MMTMTMMKMKMMKNENDDNDENDKKMMAMDGWHAHVITPNSSHDRTRK